MPVHYLCYTLPTYDSTQLGSLRKRAEHWQDFFYRVFVCTLTLLSVPYSTIVKKE